MKILMLVWELPPHNSGGSYQLAKALALQRDLSAWLGNAMQQHAITEVYKLENDILASGNQQLIAAQRRVQTSDHVYYMCSKWFRDGAVHAYFSPYDSPYDAFIYVCNVLRDIQLRLLGGVG